MPSLSKTHALAEAPQLPGEDRAAGPWLAPAHTDRARGLRSLRALVDRVLLPCAGAALVGILSGSYELLVLSFLSFLAAHAVVRANPPWRHLVGFAQIAFEGIPPAAALTLTILVAAISGLPLLNPDEVGVVLLASALLGALTSALIGKVTPSGAPTRIAVIGSGNSGFQLAGELEIANVSRYTVVGRVSYADQEENGHGDVPLLGSLDELGSIVERHRIDLLVMTSEVPRFRVFEQVANTCLHLPVRLVELTGLYEDVFGHVPVGEINAAWFQYIMHPRYSPITPHAKRAFDLVVATVLGVVFLPVLAICALLVKRDGGPALFKQVRIGEGGKPLAVYKLRTMVVNAGVESQWASAGDPRITPIGGVLRKLHLDELPQIVNVLRGEMSIVGPRPEQPEFVERLEGLLPFYSRRHLIKPGITGWAQVRCGYAGSDVGSAWKLCHDLYYLKYRSTAFDLSILAETLISILGIHDHSINTSIVRLVESGSAPLIAEPIIDSSFEG